MHRNHSPPMPLLPGTFDFSGGRRALSAAGRIIGGLAIAMACQPGKIRKRPGLAKVEEDVGCARLHSCGRVLFLFYGKDTIER